MNSKENQNACQIGTLHQPKIFLPIRDCFFLYLLRTHFASIHSTSSHLSERHCPHNQLRNEHPGFGLGRWDHPLRALQAKSLGTLMDHFSKKEG
jgi:hypothetical protein